MAVATYTKSGTKNSTVAVLPKSIFSEKIDSYDLLKLAYDAYLSNGRGNSAKVLTRGNVRGGGKKPWKQKGTGRARHGSIRSPIWRGGGITFGPTGEENYTKKLSKKANKKALRQALTIANTEGKLSVIEAFESKDGKTSETAKLLTKIGAQRRILVVVEDKTEVVDRCSRNLPNVKVTQALYLNVYDLINADSLIVTKKSLEIIEEWLRSDK